MLFSNIDRHICKSLVFLSMSKNDYYYYHKTKLETLKTDLFWRCQRIAVFYNFMWFLKASMRKLKNPALCLSKGR